MTHQPQTFTGLRGETKISGVTFKQVYEIVNTKLEYFHPERSDPDAFCQDMCCQIEKLMGIYPNVPRPSAAAPSESDDVR